MCEYILKVRKYRICNWKFLFFKMANTPNNGKTRHIAWLSSFLYKVQCFIEMKMTLQLITNTIREGKGTLCVLVTFLKNDNSNCFGYTSSFHWKSSFVLIYYKREDGYPNFLFSFLLLIALYTNFTYMIWLKIKKTLCGILFSKFLTRDDFFVLHAIIFNSRFWHSLTGFIHQNHRHLSWYPSYFEIIIAVDLKKNIINFFILFIYLLANTHSTLQTTHPEWRCLKFCAIKPLWDDAR